MSSLPSVDSAVYSKLSGDAGVAALVSTRIFNLLAPSGTTFPYIIFYLGSGVVPNAVPRDVLNYVYRIEGIAETRAGAEAIQQAIYAALHEQALTVSGWSNYWLVCEGISTLIETVDGNQIWRYVGDYRSKFSSD